MSPKKKIITEEINEVEIEIQPETPPEPKFLSDTEAVFFYNATHDSKPDVEVPPCTPEKISSLTLLPRPFPATFPSFTNFNIPYVREIGVKNCMEILGDFLDCKNYAYDFMQFWFIDILVDCLWKTQDEYYLREQEQKMVLDWIVYTFTMLTDQKLCFSRKQFFKFFKEIIFLAVDFLNEGNQEIPHPNELFTMTPSDIKLTKNNLEVPTSRETEQDYFESSDSDSVSTISFSTCQSKELIEMEIGDQKRSFVIERKRCLCHMEESSTDNYDFPTSLSSSLSSTKRLIPDTPSTDYVEKEIFESPTAEEENKDSTQRSGNDSLQFPTTEGQEFQNKYYKCFHQPDPNVPKRFLPLFPNSNESEISISVDGNRYNVYDDSGGEYEGLEMDVDANFMSPTIISDKPREEALKAEEDQCKPEDSTVHINKPSSTRISVPSDMRASKRSSSNLNKKIGSKDFSKTIIKTSGVNFSEADVMKRLQLLKLCEKRLADMSDPDIGWVPSEPDEVSIKSDIINIDNEDWEEIVDPKDIKQQDERLYIGFGVLCAIVDFVFDYFYRNFHYTLIKLATNNIPSVITQRLNVEWKVPKIAKGDFRRPKAEKKKKEKVKKEPAPKKSKPSKDTRKGSKSDKKSKGKGSDKKSKSSKESKKGKKEKPHKLSKEEKAELDRLRQLEEEAEDERRRLEENKRFVFPLVDAATDALFMDIFEDWSNPKKDGDKDKKGKGKDKKKKKK